MYATDILLRRSFLSIVIVLGTAATTRSDITRANSSCEAVALGNR